MKQVFAFDFDGTLTTCDSMVELIRMHKGTVGFWWAIVCLLPYIVLVKLGRYPNDKAKERFFRHCFGGMTEGDFNALCSRFARERQDIWRMETKAKLKEALQNGAQVLVVSASASQWVRPFLDVEFSADEVTLLSTELEISDGKVTGRLSKKNCRGAEKVRRIKELLPDRSSYHLTAFGDSSGDNEMLAYADEAVRIKSEGMGEVIRFGIVGVAATAIQYLSYLLLIKWIFPEAANTLAYLISFAFNFVASTRYTFKVKANARRGVGFAFSHLINYLLQTASLWLFLQLGISAEWAPVPMFCICVPVNFLLVRFFLKGNGSKRKG